jgi:hypothetical protein
MFAPLATLVAFALSAAATAAPSPSSTRTDVVDHDVVVTIDPAAGSLSLVDRVRLPAGRRDVVFELHEGLSPVVEGGVIAGRGGGAGFDVLRVHADGDVVVVRARGRIVHPPVQVATEHQRSFQETIGTIEPRGVYLAPESRWLPTVVDDVGVPLLVTGRVRATVEGVGDHNSGARAAESHPWRTLSEGAFDATTSTWTQQTPVEGLHLLAGRYQTFQQTMRGVDVGIWMRPGDDGRPAPDAAALADRYLEVSGQYLEQYEKLIGKYPYTRFTLVENFWETGYGMPSFTVLGPQVVRLPFILHTSWPHELLHNWWGNGVFPMPGAGNWTEGLTAYLADHLHDEQQGRGVDHRRAILQRYQDFVAVDAGRDFPLIAFTNRSSASTEAVGYGKTAMVFHMLRRRLGDDAFVAGLQRLWRDKQFARASFDDVRDAFSAAAPAEGDLADFFAAWTTQTGAPTLRLVEVSTSHGPEQPGARWRTSIVVEQTQPGPVFPIDVPFVVTTVDGRTVSSVLPLRDRRGRATVEVPADVARVDVDPFFDVFRTLSPDEVPPALSRALGAPKMLFVTPSDAPADEHAGWRAFSSALCPDPQRCRVVDDRSVGTLPADAAIWVLGSASLLRGGVFARSRDFDARFDDHGFFPPGAWDRVRAAKDRLAALRAEVVDPAKSSIVVVVEHPRDRRGAMVFVGAPLPAHIPLLGKKVPHYGKYSYLAFTGTQAAPERAENSAKGTWASTTSPLSWRSPGATATLSVRPPPALIALPPPFDGEAMRALVGEIASPALQGRGSGTEGLARARDVVVAALARGGVKADIVCDAVDKTLCNVIARLPGSDPALPRVVLGAHLDHLGVVDVGGKRTVHPGADDNASGVAVVVEVARQLGRGGGARGVDVVFFDGEETGRRGSRAFVAAEKPGAFFAMVNLDTVGRLGGRKLLVLDGDSATEWVHAFRGVGFTTGVGSELAPQGGGASDQQSFLDVGVPAVQLFSGPNGDYHRASDVVERVEPSSLVQAAVVAREIVAWLRDRREPLSWGRAPLNASSSAAGTGATAPGTGAPRRASLGSVPDMTFGGPGVRFDDVVAGSAAAAAGLQRGDVLVAFDGVDVADLRAYSELLKRHAPGDRVVIVVVRGGARQSVEVVLGAR